MRVLMLSRDRSGLAPSSPTSQRWRLLRAAGVELEVVVLSQVKAERAEPGIRVYGTGGTGRFGRLLAMHRSAARLIGTCDLVTSQDPFEPGWIAYRVSRRAGKRFELQDHGGFFDGECADEPFWHFRSRLARWLAWRADSIRTVSTGSQTELDKAGLTRKTYFLPIAARKEFATLQRQPEVGLIVSVGRLVHVKRFDRLLEAFAFLQRDVPVAKLVIVGDGPLRSDLEARAHHLGIASDVTFAGNADPASYLARASAFALLSMHEGWGVAAIEAAMARVPVVMTDTGCARWLESCSRALVVKRAEAAETVEQLKQVLEWPALPSFGAVLGPESTAMEQVRAWERVICNGPSFVK